MAQLYFKYGAMNSGKSIEILKVAHNYEEQGKNVLLLTSSLDSRTLVGSVSSRIGIQRPAIPVSKDDSILKLVGDKIENCHCVLVDEAQFFTALQIRQLATIVDVFNIPVMAFGLKNDFQNNLFAGTAELLLYADKIEEVKTICWYCQKKATMNARVIDGRHIFDGEQLQIGGNESYRSVCRKHYHDPTAQ